MGALEGLGGQILDTFVKSENCLRRFGRVLSAAGASRRGPGSPKWMQNRYKFLSKRVSVTISGPDPIFSHIFLCFSGFAATVKYSNYIVKMQ